MASTGMLCIWESPEDNEELLNLKDVSGLRPERCVQRGVMYRLQWSWDLKKMCPYPHFRGWYVQASMELGPEDVSLLERCPHFRGWHVEASMELGPEGVPLLGEVSSFQR